MNKKLIFKILGIILGIEGVSLLIPFVIALVCRENTAVFGVTALLCGGGLWLYARMQAKGKKEDAKKAN